MALKNPLLELNANRPGLFLFILLWLSTFGHAEESFRFAAIGDGGCGCSPQQLVAAQMLSLHSRNPFSVVLMLGDNIYGDESLIKFFARIDRGGDPDLFKARFDRAYNQLRKRGVRFYAALGNHDLETERGRYEILDTERFNILSEAGYYSFQPSPLIEFFALYSNPLADKKGDPTQLEWLQRALGASQVPWKIVYLHHPPYSPRGSHGEEVRVRERIENILVENGVKVVLAGHNHYYARSKPQRGITYFVSGGAGRSLRTPKLNSTTEIAERTYHFLYFEAFPDSLEFRAISSRGEIIDAGAVRR